jgi:hypothetical protein
MSLQNVQLEGELAVDERDVAALRHLHELGYKQVLPRKLGIPALTGLAVGLLAPTAAVPANFLLHVSPR